MTGCRIGKVRYKSAPHLAEIIPQVRGAEFQKYLAEDVENLFDWAGADGIAGAAIIGFDFKGHYLRAMYVHKEAYFGKVMFPSMVAEVLRRDISRDIAQGVLKGDE